MLAAASPSHRFRHSGEAQAAAPAKEPGPPGLAHSLEWLTVGERGRVPPRSMASMQRGSAVIMVGGKVAIFTLFFWFNLIFACSYFLVFHNYYMFHGCPGALTGTVLNTFAPSPTAIFK